MAVVRALMCASSSSVGEPSPGFGRVEIFAEVSSRNFVQSHSLRLLMVHTGWSLTLVRTFSRTGQW